MSSLELSSARFSGYHSSSALRRHLLRPFQSSFASSSSGIIFILFTSSSLLSSLQTLSS